jgi:hypothetical protein
MAVHRIALFGEPFARLTSAPRGAGRRVVVQWVFRLALSARLRAVVKTTILDGRRPKELFRDVRERRVP